MTGNMTDEPTAQLHRQALDGARKIYSAFGMTERLFDAQFERVLEVPPEGMLAEDFYRLFLEAVRSNPETYPHVIKELQRIDAKRVEAPEVYTPERYPEMAFHQTFMHAVLAHFHANPKRPMDDLQPSPDFWNDSTFLFGYSILNRYYRLSTTLGSVLLKAGVEPARIDRVLKYINNCTLDKIARQAVFDWVLWDALATDWELLKHVVCVWMPQHSANGPLSFGTRIILEGDKLVSIPTPAEDELCLVLIHLYRTQTQLHGLNPVR